MQFINVAAVALMSLVCNTMVHGAGSDHVARIAVPEARAITDGDLETRQISQVELNHEFELAPRAASTNHTVTVTITSIPDYCSTASVPALTSAGPLAIPTGGIYPVPKNVTAMMGTGTGANSTLTASKTSTLVSVSPTAPIATATSNDASSGSYSVLLLVATVALAFVHSVMLV